MKNILTIIEHEEIIVDDIRYIEKKTISKEDKELLLSMLHKDRFNKEKYVFSRKGRYGIKANSIVGSISLKNGLIIEILPKFAKNDLTNDSIKKYRKTLLNMIRVSNEKNFISSTTQSSKVSMAEMPLIHYIVELFSESLLNSLRNGVFSTYNKTIEKSSNIRGKILVSKTIQSSLIDKSKVYISYNKHSANNFLMQIFRTLSQILLNDKNLSYKAKQNLYEVYLLLDGVNIIHLKQHDFDKITFNRLNDKFEILFTQSEFIFNQYMPYSSSINSSPFWAILFDMDYLFEKFCAYLFRKSNIEIEEQSVTDCFINEQKTVRMKPDFIIQNNVNLSDSKIVNVVDAKWKLLSKKKSLYGLDAQNFWQLFSYMNLVHTEQINGYFIIPKSNNDLDDTITFKPIKENNRSITILSIDFSLEFEDLVNKYSFEIINKELKLKTRVVKQELEIRESFNEKEKIITQEEGDKFKFKEFIDELYIAHSNSNHLLKKYAKMSKKKKSQCKKIYSKYSKKK